MRTLPDQSSVIYRVGLEDCDYDEAIEALKDAKRQRGNEGQGCSVCCDSGHTASQCHHNPLVMARRAVAQTKVWRCYHCDAVFTDYTKATEHFGTREDNKPQCIKAVHDFILNCCGHVMALAHGEPVSNLIEYIESSGGSALDAAERLSK